MSFPKVAPNLSTFIKSIAVPLLVGLISGLLTRQSMYTFSIVNKPALSPPAILFPIVWTIIYILMGISEYLIKTSGENKDDIASAEQIYGLQLIVNFLWPTFFFHFQWYLFSFFWILLLWVLVLIMIIRFYRISPAATYINVPYLLWLTFAAYLNLGIFLLN